MTDSKKVKLPDISATRKVFVAMTNTDLTEGRGTEYALCVCANRATAHRLGKGKHVMGSDCVVLEVDAFYVYGSGWYVPGGRIIEPTHEDILNEKRMKEESAKKIVLEKFRKDEPITKEEREIILKMLDGKA